MPGTNGKGEWRATEAHSRLVFDCRVFLPSLRGAPHASLPIDRVSVAFVASWEESIGRALIWLEAELQLRFILHRMPSKVVLLPAVLANASAPRECDAHWQLRPNDRHSRHVTFEGTVAPIEEPGHSCCRLR